MTRRNVVSVAISDPELEVLRTIPAKTDSERLRMLIRKLIMGEWVPESNNPRGKKKA